MNINIKKSALSMCFAAFAVANASAGEASASSTSVSNMSLKDMEAAGKQDGPMSSEEMAKKSANPMSDVWMLLTQNDSSYLKGDATGGGGSWSNSFKLQPVMPVPIMGGDWNLIVRPVFSYVSSPFNDSATNPLSRTDGLADTVLLTLLGPNTTDGLVWGVGLSQIFPTATDDILGQGKWQAGPAFVVASLGTESGGMGIKNWNIGMLAQQWWSYGGDNDRAETSQMDIQYFINWRINETALIGMTPNININWRADSGNQIAVPIGLGYIDVIKIGKLPIRVGIEAQYYVVQRDMDGPDWNFRLIFSPIIKNPFK